MNEHWTPQDWRELLKACSKTQNYLIDSIIDLKCIIEQNRRHTLIRSLSSRLKDLEDIHIKLLRYGFEDNPTSAFKNLHDIVGIRLICSYLNDIYEVMNALSTLENFTIVQIKDYIKDPKLSGYHSLHVIGVCDISGYPIQCEIQIRTTGMDSWAALEHQMRYKKNLPDSQYVNQELLDIANTLYECDVRMQTLHNFVDDQRDHLNHRKERSLEKIDFEIIE